MSTRKLAHEPVVTARSDCKTLTLTVKDPVPYFECLPLKDSTTFQTVLEPGDQVFEHPVCKEYFESGEWISQQDHRTDKAWAGAVASKGTAERVKSYCLTGRLNGSPCYRVPQAPGQLKSQRKEESPLLASKVQSRLSKQPSQTVLESSHHSVHSGGAGKKTPGGRAQSGRWCGDTDGDVAGSGASAGRWESEQSSRARSVLPGNIM